MQLTLILVDALLASSCPPAAATAEQTARPQLVAQSSSTASPGGSQSPAPANPESEDLGRARAYAQIGSTLVAFAALMFVGIQIIRARRDNQADRTLSYQQTLQRSGVQDDRLEVHGLLQRCRRGRLRQEDQGDAGCDMGRRPQPAANPADGGRGESKVPSDRAAHLSGVLQSLVDAVEDVVETIESGRHDDAPPSPAVSLETVIAIPKTIDVQEADWQPHRARADEIRGLVVRLSPDEVEYAVTVLEGRSRGPTGEARAPAPP